jgi:hypothetical protein
MKAISRIRKIKEHTPDSFRGIYKGYDIEIERDLERDKHGYVFYITVRNPEIAFGTNYDGWWEYEGSAYPSIEDAVEEALKGSGFI